MKPARQAPEKIVSQAEPRGGDFSAEKYTAFFEGIGELATLL